MSEKSDNCLPECENCEAPLAESDVFDDDERTCRYCGAPSGLPAPDPAPRKAGGEHG